jgi:hypothetical protein
MIAGCKKPPAPTRTRTLPELISYAEKEGRDGSWTAGVSSNYGLSGDRRTKHLLYELSPEPRLVFRSLEVVYDDSRKPVALLWTDSKPRVPDPPDSEDTWEYKTSMTGELEAVVHIVDRSPSRQPINDDHRAAYRKLVAFFLEEATALKPRAKQ